jgi:antigen flippase
MNVLWRKVAETGAARTYSVVMGMVALFLTARLLGPEGQGVIAASIAWVGLFASFAGLSLGQVAQYRIQVRRDEGWLPDILGTLSFFALVLTILAYVIAFLAYRTTDGNAFKGIPPAVLAISFLMLPLLIWEEYTRNLLGATGHLRTYNNAQFVGRTLWLCGIILLVGLMGLGISGALAAQISGQGVIAFVGFATLWRASGRLIRIDRHETRELLKSSAKLHLNSVGSFLLSQTSILILNHFSSKVEVGYYQIAFQMVTILTIFPQAASIALFSEMAKTGPDRLWSSQKRLTLQMLSLIALISVPVYLAAPIFIPTLMGLEFNPAVKMFRYLLPIAFGISFAQLMTPQWIGRGIFLGTTLATFFTAIANIVANFVLIPYQGAMGAVWANLICYGFITIAVQFYFAWWCEKRSVGARVQRITG